MDGGFLWERRRRCDVRAVRGLAIDQRLPTRTLIAHSSNRTQRGCVPILDIFQKIRDSLAFFLFSGTHPNGGLFRTDDVERLNKFTNFSALTYCSDPFLELLHGTVHMWVGGHMNEMRISPNDPTFYLFHSHVDYLWEQWRRLRQTDKQRENDYPTDQQSCSSHHYKDSPMKPFVIKNLEGLSNRYTNVFYSYDPSPTCSKERRTCGSKWLFCDTNAR